jgi:hypothetical protein
MLNQTPRCEEVLRWRYSATNLTSALEKEVSGQLHATVAFTPGTHWIGGWVDPRAGLDAVEKKKFPVPATSLTLKPQSSSLSPVTIPTELPRLLDYFHRLGIL